GLEEYVHLDRWVATRVKDLAAADAVDTGPGHRSSSSVPAEPLDSPSPISSTTWSKSSPSSSPPISWPIFFAQRAMLFGSFSSTSPRSALSLSRSSRLSSESTCAVREMSLVRWRPPQRGQAGEVSTAAKLKKKIDGRLPQSAQRY